MKSPNTWTVLGAGGWIGSSMVAALRRQGCSVNAVDRDGLSAWLLERDNLGPVIYAIGLTSDFRHRPHETAEAHVALLSRVIQRPGLHRLLYISSSRVYSHSESTRETDPVPCLVTCPEDLYNVSKLMGEALILQDPRPGLKAVRLSNVLGPNQPACTFFGQLLNEAASFRDPHGSSISHGTVAVRQPPSTAKDYVALDDVLRLLPLISEHGVHRLYNLGSGRNISHQQLATWLKHRGINVEFVGESEPSSAYPPLSIDRLQAEFTIPGHPLRDTTLSYFFG